MNKSENKFKIQENQYEFPYHHIPYLDGKGNVVRYRILNWGFKYFCYLLHIKEKIEFLEPRSVLDVGCGDGRLLGLLDSRIEIKVGVDLSERSIAFARALYGGIEFHNEDAINIDESFDVVVAMEVLEHVPDKAVDDFFKTLESKVKEGGYIVISVPTVVQPLNKKHYRHYDIDLFKKQLEKSDVGLSIKSVEYIYKEPLWLRVYNKITINKLWLFEVKFLNKIVWKCVWKRLRIAEENNGHDLVVTLQKN